MQEQFQRALLLVARAARSHARSSTVGSCYPQGVYHPALAAVQHALHTASAALQPSSPSQRCSSAPAWSQQRGVPISRGFSAVPAAAASVEGGIVFAPNAVERLQELANETPGQLGVLRLMVEGGGCSGYTYLFSLESAVKPEDKIFEQGGVQLVIDPVSYEFVKGATVDYTTDIIRSAFEVVTNPNAEASCGCGSSFAPKD